MKDLLTKNLLPTSLIFAFGLLLFVPTNFVHAQTSVTSYNSANPVSPSNYDQATDMEYCTQEENKLESLKPLAANAPVTSYNNPGASCDPTKAPCVGTVTVTNQNADGSNTSCVFGFNKQFEGGASTATINMTDFQSGSVNFPAANVAGSQTKSVAISQTLLQAFVSSAPILGNNKNLLTATPVAGTNGTGAATGGSTEVKTVDTGGADCSFSNIGNCVITGVALLAYVLFAFAGYLLSMVGILLNWTIQFTVFQFGSYFGNSSGLLIGWGILRDIGNIVLLFSFIFLGIMMVLNLDSAGSRQAIPKLLIVALLLNFSLFMTEAVIDVSNVLSAALYNQASTSCQANGTNCTTASSNSKTFVNNGIAGQILQAGGLNTVFTITPQGSGNTSSNGTPISFTQSPFNKLVFYVMLTIFVSVTIVVLLAAAVLLLIRGIVLVFIMVTSPLGFVATIVPIPAFQGIASTWRKLLLSESFFAPVLLLLILVSLKIIAGLSSAINPSSGSLVAAISSGNTDINFTSIILLFSLVIGFMIASLMSAKQLGAVGATAVTNAATKAVRSTVTAPLRLGAFGASVGYRTFAAPHVNNMQKGFNTFMGNWRNKDGISGKIGGFVDNTIGASVSGAIGSARDLKFGGAKGYTERKKEIKERTDTVAHAAEKAANESQFRKGLASGNLDDVERAMQKMPQSDLEGLVATLNDADLKSVAKIMSSDKLDKFLSNDKVNARLKENIVKARFEDFEHAIEAYESSPAGPARDAAFKKAQTEARKLSSKETKILGTFESDLFDRATNITDDASTGGTGDSIWSNSQIDDINKNEVFTTRQRGNAFSKKPVEQLKQAVGPGGSVAAIPNLVRNMRKEIGDLPSSVLTNPTVIDNLNAVHLSSIMSKDTLTQTERNAIINHIGRKPDTDPQYIATRKYLDASAARRNWWGNTLP
jgi:hypothetical protein